MRTLALGLSALTILTLAALSAPANAVNPTRSAGAYSVIETRDVNACARACADDGLCLVWLFSDAHACELMAVVPASTPPGVTFGLSSRAPASMRPLSVVEPAITGLLDKPNAPDPAAAPPHVPTDIANAPETEDTLALLGGPDEEMLRPRLGARQ